jgi:hypothetical protein
MWENSCKRFFDAFILPFYTVFCTLDSVIHEEIQLSFKILLPQ